MHFAFYILFLAGFLTSYFTAATSSSNQADRSSSRQISSSIIVKNHSSHVLQSSKANHFSSRQIPSSIVKNSPSHVLHSSRADRTSSRQISSSSIVKNHSSPTTINTQSSSRSAIPSSHSAIISSSQYTTSSSTSPVTVSAVQSKSSSPATINTQGSSQPAISSSHSISISSSQSTSLSSTSSGSSSPITINTQRSSKSVVSSTISRSQSTSSRPLTSSQVAILPLASAASAASVAKSASSAAALYIQNPTSSNAQSAYNAIEAAVTAAGLITAGTSGTLRTAFSSLLSALKSMVPLAASAVDTPGAATASTLANALPGVEQALNSEEEAQSSSASESVSSTTSTTRTDITITTSATQSIGSWGVDVGLLLAMTVDSYVNLTNNYPSPIDLNYTAVLPAPVLTSTQGSSSTSTSSSPQSTPTGNPSGTNVHVKSGCANINGSPRCVNSSPYNVAYQDQFNSTTVIYSLFDSQDGSNQNVTPGCQLNAFWPYNYGDIYLEADNCLYDASGNKIYNQCCTASTTNSVSNPYYQNPSGFYIEALKCDNDCEDTLEIVPYSKNNCSQIVNNQVSWWGSAHPPSQGTTDLTDSDEIAPFSLLDTMNSGNPEVIIYYVYGDNFLSALCGITNMNITLTKTSSGGYDWADTDTHSGICQDVSSTSATTCSLNSEDYTAQELLYCFDPSNPSYCSQ